MIKRIKDRITCITLNEFSKFVCFDRSGVSGNAPQLLARLLARVLPEAALGISSRES